MLAALWVTRAPPPRYLQATHLQGTHVTRPPSLTLTRRTVDEASSYMAAAGVPSVHSYIYATYVIIRMHTSAYFTGRWLSWGDIYMPLLLNPRGGYI